MGGRIEMARIRSFHPSTHTNPDWVSCSAMARLLCIGIWTDADDQGVFEWNPLQLKMRLLPADTVDMAELLAELAQAGLIAQFVHGGRSYGAIKDFRKYQRPKKPNAIHPLPPQWRTYVGLSTDGSEPGHHEPSSVPHQFPTDGGNPPQMEDGGEDEGGGEEEDANASVVAKGDVAAAFAEWNALAKRLNLPIAKDLTPDRRKCINARLASSGLTGWREALAAVEASPHCRGENDRGWRATIDFVASPTKFQRLREGSYGPVPSPAMEASTVTFDGPPELRAAIVSIKDEDFFRTWVAHYCRWRAADRTIIARNEAVAATLRRELARYLADREITVQVAAANDAHCSRAVAA